MRARLLTLAVALVSLVNTPALAHQPGLQTFTTEDGAFSFEYPASWSVEIINADQGPNAHLSVDNLPLEQRFDSPEGVNLQVYLPRKFYEFGFSGGETPSEMVAQLVHGSSQPAAIDFGTPSAEGTPQPLQLQPVAPDVTEFSVNGRPAAYAYSVMQVMGMDASRLIIIADLGNDYWVSISATSFAGGLKTIQQYEPIILAIVQTMRHTPPPPVYSGNPDLPQVYSGLVGIWQRGTIQFYYPEDWHVSNVIMVMFSNKQGNLLNTQPEPGQFIAIVEGVSETITSVDRTEFFNHCNTQNRDWTARELVAQLLGNVTPAQLEQMNNAGITFTQPEVVTVNDVEIVYMRQYQGDFEVLSMFIDLGEGNIPSTVVTSLRGEMAQFEDQLFAVASTFQYTPKPCDEAETESQ